MGAEKAFFEFVKRAEAEGLKVEAAAVADGEKILFEHHFAPDKARNIYSHTKSYTVSAVGMAVSDGALSLDTRLADVFRSRVPDGADEALGEIRLRHLLTMSSGFGEALLMNAQRRAGVGAPDQLAYMLSRSVKEKPGTRFVYSSADSILAARMLEEATGRRIGEYLYERLFFKLGQGWPLWEHCPQGHANGGGGIHMRLADMLKLGQLYLNGGVWKGERILDGAWVRECTSKQIDTPASDDVWSCGYGYQFWISPYPNSYRADGAYGQVTTVLPKAGLVTAVQCPEEGDFAAVKAALHEMMLEMSLC